jgi:hypothetical protein
MDSIFLYADHVLFITNFFLDLSVHNIQSRKRDNKHNAKCVEHR